MLLNASPLNGTALNASVGPTLFIQSKDEYIPLNELMMLTYFAFPATGGAWTGFKQKSVISVAAPTTFLLQYVYTDGRYMVDSEFDTVVNGRLLTDTIKDIDGSFETTYRNVWATETLIINNAYALSKFTRWPPFSGLDRGDKTQEDKSATALTYANPSAHLMTVTYSDSFANGCGFTDYDAIFSVYVRFGSDLIQYVTDAFSAIYIPGIPGLKTLTDTIILWSQGIFYDLTYIESDKLPQPVDYWWPKVNNTFRIIEIDPIKYITDTRSKLQLYVREEDLALDDFGGYSKEDIITAEDDLDSFITDSSIKRLSYRRSMDDAIIETDNIIKILLTYNIKVQQMNDFLIFNDGLIEYRVLKRTLEDDVKYIVDQFIKFGSISIRQDDKIIINDASHFSRLKGTILGDAIKAMVDSMGPKSVRNLAKVDFFTYYDDESDQSFFQRGFDEYLFLFEDAQVQYIPAELVAPEIRIQIAVDDSGIKIGVDNTPIIILGAYS